MFIWKYFFPAALNKQQIIINNQVITVEIARTPVQLSQGLSGREKLCENCGMLFVFPVAGKYPFWMNEMKFNLDFVYINGKTVVDMVENVPYPKNGEQPQVIEAKKDFNEVLEIDAGTIRKLKIKIGDGVDEIASLRSQ